MKQELNKEVLRLLVLLGICVIAAVIGLVSGYFYGNDNYIEQMAEKAIENISGLEVDLSDECSKENLQ